MNEFCTECGKLKDKFSIDNDYEQCELCSIRDVNNLFDKWETIN